MMNQVRNTSAPPSPRCGPKSMPFSTGANTGSTIRQISIQSKKKPSTNTRPMTNSRISQPVSRPSAFSTSVTMSSPPSARNTNANSVAPKKMKNTSALVSAALSIIEFSAFRLSLPLNQASTSAPAAPTPAASVGVAQPPKIDPSTSTIRNVGGRKLLPIITQNSRALFGPISGGSGGASPGLRKLSAQM